MRPSLGKLSSRWVKTIVALIVSLAIGFGIYLFNRPSVSSPQTVLPFTGLEAPSGVAVGSSGTVYAVNDSKVASYVPWSNTQGAHHVPTDGHLKGPAVGRDGTIYVADSSHDRLFQFRAGSAKATVVPIAGPSSVATPQSLAVDEQGSVYVGDGLGDNVEKLDPRTGALVHLPFTGLKSSNGVAVDKQGNVYVADSGNNRVVKLAKWSKTQSVLPFTGLDQPWGVAVDRNGNVYVSDRHHNRVLKLAAGSTSPTTLPFAGLHGPTGVAVDDSGNVYVADHDNDRVLELPSQ